MVRRGTSRRTLAAALALGVPLALAGCGGGDEAGGGGGGAVDSLRVLD